jgi:hypothetical protein
VSFFLFVSPLVALTGACSSDEAKSPSENTGGAPSSGGGPGSGGSGEADDPEPTAEDFKCITDGTLVQRFYITNRYGDLGNAEEVANSPTGGTYPLGTIIQLLPGEAMVKRYAGYSADTSDWEFFFLNVTATGSEIKAKGTKNVVNGFGLNCFDCHAKAEPQFDFVCSKTHGCDPLPFSDDQIASLQSLDARCGSTAP